MRSAPPTEPGTPISPSIPPRSCLAQKVTMRPRSAAPSTCAKLPSKTTSGSDDASCRTIHGSSPSPTNRLEPPPRKWCGTPWESSRLSRPGMASCFLMRRRSVVPPMARDVSSASEEARRSSTLNSERAATTLGSSMRMGGGVFGAKQNHQLVAGAADVAGADGQDGVEGACFAQQVLDAFLHGAGVEDILVPGFANRGGQSFAGDAGNGRLACRVNVGEHQHVGLVEGAAEFVPEMLRARVAMGLEEHQQAIEFADARGFQCHADFGGVMAVIVDHRNVIDRSFDFEAAHYAREFAEALADQLRGDIEIQRDGGSGCGVAHVVDARRVEKLEDAEIVALVGQSKFAAKAFALDVADDEIGLARSDVGDDRALDVGNDGLHVGLVQAKNRRAVKWHAIHELHEGILNVFQRRVLVKVLAVDGGDDRNYGREQQETAVAFVGFDHEKFAFTEPRRRTGLIDAAANDKRGIEMRRG